MHVHCVHVTCISNAGDVLPAISSILGLDGPALEALAASTTQHTPPVVSTSLPGPISLPTPPASTDQNTAAGKKIATNTQDKGQCVLVDLHVHTCSTICDDTQHGTKYILTRLAIPHQCYVFLVGLQHSQDFYPIGKQLWNQNMIPKRI